MVSPSFYGAAFFMVTLSVILIMISPSVILITPSVILSEAKNLVRYGKQKGPWESGREKQILRFAQNDKR